MRKALCCLVVVVMASFTALLARPDESPNDKQARAKKLFDENNFNEALTLYRELAVDPETAGPAAAESLSQAVQSLNNLGRVPEIDALIEEAVTAQAGSWRVLARAGQIISGEIESGGFLVAGKFERGYHRGGGQWASAGARDRVRSLQLLLAADEQAAKNGAASGVERTTIWSDIAARIGAAQHGEAWKLQDLTDLTTLPDYEATNGPNYGYGRGGWGQPSKGAPVDVNGQPVFLHMPESWNTAKSDGERWRWALSRVVELNNDRRSEIDLSWAAFLQSQFERHRRRSEARRPFALQQLTMPMRRRTPVSGRHMNWRTPRRLRS